MRILLVQRSLSPPGGGNAVAAWMVHALADRDISTVTLGPWSPAATNAYYGTAIPGGVARHVTPLPWRWLAGMPEHRASRMRMSAVLREAHRLSGRYDLLVTADNYGPFARPGLQYLHFPAALHPTPERLAPIVHLYFAACDRLVGVPWAAARQNVTLANSRWTAEGLARHRGITAGHVLYPPVIDPGPGLPWNERDDAFLCVGRFHGSKRIELVMSIVRRLRAGVLPEARLIVIGSAVDRDYTVRIKRAARAHGDWIEIHEDMPRDALNALMGRCRYAVQAMVDEHFGMATAELARAGCLVFAEAGGGTPEVLDREPALLWSTEDEAIARITALAGECARAEAIRSRLRDHVRQFSTEAFVDRFRRIVDEWAAAHPPAVR